mgnify:CR=1 FL=1
MHRDIRSWLAVRPEYPNFQFNETFFKPFEHLICTEQCDSIAENQVKLDLFFQNKQNRTSNFSDC